jgi:riboflavin kinase/FMN adenylyltransferase
LRRLFPREDLSERLPAYGVDLLVILPFTAAFAELPAEEFLRRYLAEPFEPRHVVAGYDVGFGKGRQGSLASLRAWASPRGVEVHAVAPLKIRGEIVSSRRVRELVTAGQVDEASELLGRPFYLRGPVVAGHGRGARIGVPTLNQQVINETLPLQGVYVTRTRLDGVSRPSVTNIGFNPTFGGETEVKVETHVLDAEVQARGRIVDVDFLKRLRPEMKFPGVEDLKKQIQDDILKARQYLGSK